MNENEEIMEEEPEGVLYTNVDPTQWMNEYQWVWKYITNRCAVKDTDDILDNFMRNISMIW